MTFDHPARFVLALLVAIAIVLMLVWIARARKRADVAYSNLEFLHAALRPPIWIERALFGAFALGMLLFATAFASPQLVLPATVRDGAVMICIDTSGSMASTDVSPTRFIAAQNAARAFAGRAARGTRVGVIAFSTSASLIQPLTGDRSQLNDAIGQLPPPNGATAIGDAIALALQELPRRGHRAIVLVTDGVNNRGTDPLDQAQLVGARGVKLYTVGIGTNSGAMIPGTGEEATIDEDSLRAYAQAGGGTYARADSANALYEALASLGSVTSLEWKRRDASFALAALGGSLLVATFITGFALGRLP